mmetsp:Transcript_32447/g.103460  ORF Transcript_32447/g.103460 Transcript_32447/m.103460 type:complete len:124 (-) Transcript_32447:132-503(-)
MDVEIATPWLRIIIEFKFCPTSKVNKTKNPARALLKEARSLIGLADETSSLRTLRISSMGSNNNTVAALQKAAATQIEGYARGLSPEKQQDDKENDRRLVGFAVSQIVDRFIIDEIDLDDLAN